MLNSDQAAARALVSGSHLHLALDSAACALLERGVRDALTFFRLSEREKSVCGLPQDCGYRASGIEYSQVSNRPDPIESFTASERTKSAADALPHTAGRALHSSLLLLFESLLGKAEALTKAAASEVGGASNYHAGMLRAWSCVQVNYSRPSESSGEWIHESHEDGHLWTLAHATAPGLELARGDAFVAVEPKPCEMVVMPGEIARLLSGGAIAPLYHRVRPDLECAERIATLLFVDADPSQCKPWVVNDNNVDVDIPRHIRSNAARFGLRGFADE